MGTHVSQLFVNLTHLVCGGGWETPVSHPCHTPSLLHWHLSSADWLSPLSYQWQTLAVTSESATVLQVPTQNLCSVFVFWSQYWGGKEFNWISLDQMFTKLWDGGQKSLDTNMLGMQWWRLFPRKTHELGMLFKSIMQWALRLLQFIKVHKCLTPQSSP